MSAHKKIRVLIVDDSSVIRTLLTKILSSDPQIEVVGTAPDPYVAREKIVALTPDVITLDVEMPRMDGLTFLGKLMKHLPTRTIIISSLSTVGSATALRALELGAVDVIAKPALDVTRSLEEMGKDIIAAIKNASHFNLGAAAKTPRPVASATAVAKVPVNTALIRSTHQVLAIASSTGGTEALKVLLAGLPHDIPGTLIVQHMPPVFTKTYAETLDKMFPFSVKEAKDGDRVLPGQVLLAPGNFHMEVVRSGAHYMVKLHQEPLLHGVRPAADYMMKSVAKHVGANAIGIVLTGMGKDGAAGLLEMKNAGSYNISQNEETCVVYGMPKAAVELNAVHKTLPLQDIAGEILGVLRRREAA